MAIVPALLAGALRCPYLYTKCNKIHTVRLRKGNYHMPKHLTPSFNCIRCQMVFGFSPEVSVMNKLRKHKLFKLSKHRKLDICDNGLVFILVLSYPYICTRIFGLQEPIGLLIFNKEMNYGRIMLHYNFIMLINPY